MGVLDLPTFLVGLVIVILLPGPNSLYVLATASRHGVRPGFSAATGVWVGDTVLMVLAAGGVASLLQANEFLFGAVKFFGASYLAWLGLGLLRAAVLAVDRRREPETQDAGGGRPPQSEAPSAAAAFRRALGVSLLNPKAILFFVSFLVQFVDPGYAHPWASFLLLGGMVQVASVLYLSTLILLGHRLADAFRRRRALAAGATATAGALFLAVAVKLGLATAA